MKNITDDIDLYRTFWISSQGETTGPFTLEQIGVMWRAGRIYATDQACEAGTETWFPVTTLRRDFPEIMSTGRTVAPSNAVATGMGKDPVNLGVYRVLAILLGHIGVHNFYSGDVSAGMWKMGMMLLGVILVISDVLAFAFFGGIFLLALVIWIFLDVINGPLDREVGAVAREQSKAEKAQARQTVMYVVFVALLLLLFLIWAL